MHPPPHPASIDTDPPIPFTDEEIGSAARRSLEGELGAKVHLDLNVQVRRSWRRDEDMLDRLGIE